MDLGLLENTQKILKNNRSYPLNEEVQYKKGGLRLKHDVRVCLWFRWGKNKTRQGITSTLACLLWKKVWTFVRNGCGGLWYKYMLLKFVWKTCVHKLEFCNRIFVMASKRWRSKSLCQMSVLQCSLDVRFQTEAEKQAFIARISRVRDLHCQKKETNWTTMSSVCCSLLLRLDYCPCRARVLFHY